MKESKTNENSPIYGPRLIVQGFIYCLVLLITNSQPAFSTGYYNLFPFVYAPPTPPSLSTFAVGTNQSITVDVLSQAVEPNNSTETILFAKGVGGTLGGLSVSGGGTAVLSGTGSSAVIKYTAPASAGSATVSYRIQNSRGMIAIGSFQVNTVSSSVWKGTTSGDWNTASNWSPSGVPTGSVPVTLDNTCTNCAVTLSADAVALNISFASTFTGSLNLSGYNLTVGSGGISIQNGTANTFVGGSGSITVNGPLNIFPSPNNTAAFKSTSGTLTVSGAVTIRSSTNFVHNNGTVVMNGTSALNLNINGTTNCSSAKPFNNLKILGSGGSYTLSKPFGVVGTLTIGNTSSTPGQLLGNVIGVCGNFAAINYGYRGTTKLQVQPTAARSFDTSAATVPNVPWVLFGGSSAITVTGNLVTDYSFQNNSTNITLPNNFSLTINCTTTAYPTISFGSAVVYSTVTFNCPGAVKIGGTGAPTIGDLNFAAVGTPTILSPPSTLRFYVQGDVTVTGAGASGSGVTLYYNLLSTQKIDISGATQGNVPGIQINNSGVGVLTLPSSGLIVNGSFIFTQGNFSPAQPSVTLAGWGTLSWPNLNNVTFSTSGTYTVSGTNNVNGILTLGGGGKIDTGSIKALGNVVVNNGGMSSSNGGYVELAGTSSQLIDVSASPNVPGLKFNNNTTVTVNGPINVTSGTLTYGQGAVSLGSYTITLTNGGFDFSNFGPLSNPVIISGYYTGAGSANTVLTGTVTLTNSFTFSGRMLDVKGDIINNSNNSYGGFGSAGGIHIVGTNNQTITSSAGSGLPPIQIEKTGGTLTFVGDQIIVDTFTYTSGTVNLGSGNYTATFGTISSGSLTFNSLAFWSPYCNTATISGTAIVNGDVNFNGPKQCSIAMCSYSYTSVDGGILQVKGNVVGSTEGDLGSVQVQMVGSQSTTWGIAGNFPTGNVTIAKTGGASVTLSSPITLAAGQSLTVSSGTLQMSGNNLSVSSLTLGAGAVINRGGGTLTVNGSVIGAGSYSGGTIN